MRVKQHIYPVAGHAMCRWQGRRIYQRGAESTSSRSDDARQRNDGVFPIAAVNEIIDGRLLIAAHGNREMPIWGFDIMVRSRISVIVDYLNRIQEK